MKNKIFASAFVFVLFCSAASAADSSDGSWSVELTPSAGNSAKGTDKAFPDVLTIKDGQLSSSVAGKQTFAPGKCDIKTEDGKTKITATLESKGHGKNHYQLELKDGVLTGKMTWECGPSERAKGAEYTIAQKK